MQISKARIQSRGYCRLEWSPIYQKKLIIMPIQKRPHNFWCVQNKYNWFYRIENYQFGQFAF